MIDTEDKAGYTGIYSERKKHRGHWLMAEPLNFIHLLKCGGVVCVSY